MDYAEDIAELGDDGMVSIPLGDGPYSADVSLEGVTVYGCDCAAEPTLEQVRHLHAILGAYLALVDENAQA